MTYTAALSAVNTPLVTGSIGAVTAVSLPILERILSTNNSIFLARRPIAVNVLNLLAYCICLYAVGQPGRLDGYYQQQQRANPKKSSNRNIQVDESTVDSAKLVEFMSLRRGGSLVTPAGWAFAIWAPIFAGEMVSTVTAVVLTVVTMVMAVQTKLPTAASAASIGLGPAASAGFMAAQVFQTLWAATFRPKYYFDVKTTSKKSILRRLAPFVSPMMLTGIALSLNRAHLAYTVTAAAAAVPHTMSMARYLLYFFPVSLHFGWTTAAALVNWNGSLANSAVAGPRTMAVAGWLSALGATIVGVAVTVQRSAPVYGAVICWALAACADGMTARLNDRDQRIQQVKASQWWQFFRNNGNKSNDSNDDDDTADVVAIRQQKGVVGAAVQKWLCTIGSVISGAVAIWTAVAKGNSSSRKSVAP